MEMNGKNRRVHRVASLALLVFSLLYLGSSWRLKMGNLHNPGPGLFPSLIGVLLVVCTGMYGFLVLRERPGKDRGNEKSSGEGKNYRAIIGILVCTAIYPLVLEPIKFILSTLTASFVMLSFLRPKRFLFSFLLSLGIAVGSFLVFSRFFGVALPSGFIENLFFRIGG